MEPALNNADHAAPADHAATTAIQAGRGAALPGRPLNVAPSLASSFRRGNGEVPGDARSYARGDATEGCEALEAVIGQLESGTAVAFASGMAAIAAALDHVRPGGRLVVPDACYQGTSALSEHVARTRGAALRRLASEDTAGWVAALRTADVVLLESPTNPLLRVADLPAIGAADPARRAVLVVDSTLATPLNQQPLALGADVVVHSATKAIGGHADLVLGVAVARKDGLIDALRTHRTLHGAVPGAMETFLATRGVRTLPLRHERAQANASTLAARLEQHPVVTVVHYPGLASHPDHALADATLAGFGSVLSFELDGDAATADRLCATLRRIVHATSLGGVESTLERRAAVPGQEHLPPTLLRLAVGCEHVDDLWADLASALAAATA